MAPTITILGGGIAGLTTAIALRNAGFRPIILESAPAVKALGAGLGLSANAIKAFKKLGIADEVIEAGRLLEYFSIYDQRGKIITRTDSRAITEKYGTDNFTIHRAALHQLLLSKLADTPVLTNKKVVAVEQTAETVYMRFRDGSVLQTDYLIAADGIHSVIRQQLQPDSSPRYAGYTCWRAVIDDAGIQLQEASETWGTSGRFGIIPLKDNKIYWFACINAPQNDTTMRQFKVADLQYNFRNYHDPVPRILEWSKDKDLLWNDIMDVKPVDRYAFGNILLVGDAAHATTPNMGQGACQAIEDAVVLADELSNHADISKAFRHFEQRRLKRTHYIINSSWNIGKAAQINNKILAGCRNFLFRHLPSRVQDKQLEKLYTVDF